MIQRLQQQEEPKSSELATVVDLPKNVIIIDSATGTGIIDPGLSSQVQLQPGLSSQVQLQPGLSSQVQLQPGLSSQVQLQPGLSSQVQLQPGLPSQVQLQTQLQIQQLQAQLQAQMQGQQFQPQVMSSVGIPAKGVSKLRTSTAGPVPERLQDKRRHYCDKCPAHYSRKDELTNHQQNNCLKTERDFICEDCNKAYYSDTTLMQHYYKIHLKQYLYYCRKCNEGFFYKSYRSTHKNACPKKDGPDLYEGNPQVPPEIMKKFRRRKKIQVTDTPSDVMEIPEDAADTGNVQPGSADPTSYFTGQVGSIPTVSGALNIGTDIIKPKSETYIPTAEDRAKMEKVTEEEDLILTGEGDTE